MKIIISCIVSILLFECVNSQITININDTTSKQDIITIHTYGTTGKIDGKTIELKIGFEYMSADVLGVSKNVDYAIHNNNYEYKYDEVERVLTITTSEMTPNFTGTLFDIDLRLLPKIDFYQNWENELIITPLSVRCYDNNTDTTYQLNTKFAKILLDTIYTAQTYKESFSYNYPNPFNYSTSVFFSINEPTYLSGELYSFTGEHLQSIPISSDGMFFTQFYDVNNKEITNLENYIFNKGIYKITLRPNPEKVFVGHYRLIFKTNTDVYTINISFIN